MATEATYIAWATFPIPKRLEELGASIHGRLEVMSHYLAKDMEDYAKLHAPWHDETGNARNGLRGTPLVVPGRSYGATISHTVPYGIWLEVRWAGKYSIISPTLRAASPKVAALLEGLMG